MVSPKVHDERELLPINLSVVVDVGGAEVHQLVEFVARDVIPDASRGARDVLEDDVPLSFDVETVEGGVERVVGGDFGHALRHFTDKLAEIHRAPSVLVDGVEHSLQFSRVGFEPEGASCEFELFLVDVAAAVRVHVTERLRQFTNELRARAARVARRSAARVGTVRIRTVGTRNVGIRTVGTRTVVVIGIGIDAHVGFGGGSRHVARGRVPPRRQRAAEQNLPRRRRQLLHVHPL